MRKSIIFAASVALAFPSIAEARTKPYDCSLVRSTQEYVRNCTYQGDSGREAPSRESKSKPDKEPSKPAPEKPSPPDKEPPTKPEGPGKEPPGNPCACGKPDNGGGKEGKGGKEKA